ncbi:MAG: protein phosphatase 2C domain-containing protein [Comamonas sp.]|nr:protein phosphatase 2C domain-containing protein [Comamonas sp.]
MKHKRTPATPPRHGKRPLLRLPGKARPSAAALLTPVPVPVPSVALQSWQLTGAAITGLAHWQKHLPCQDAVRWSQQPRPVLVLADGAGSAAVSELGAQALTQGMLRFIASLEDEVSAWLDQEHSPEALDALQARWRLRLLRHAQGLLHDLAEQHRRSVRDVRATLHLAVLGQKHCFWWQVGDGAIVVQEPAAPPDAPPDAPTSSLRVLGSIEQAKGEFANQTCFVDAASLDDVQCGHLASHRTLGWALMSDGGAEKLVAHDASRVAARLGQWLERTAQRKLSPQDLAVAYHDAAMWQRTTLDDRAIVLAGRSLPEPAP